MPNTSEKREIKRHVNAKETETIQQSKELVAKTKRFSTISDAKNMARRHPAPNGTPRVQKSLP
jgi:hypothetical protein